MPIAALLLPLAVLGTPQGDARKPDVLLVVMDDVAERDIDRIPTPTFDALAERGTRFERAYAAPTCSPARRMLHFGTFWTSDSGDPCTGEYKPGINPPAGDLSLPKLFEGANYATGLFGKWHLGASPGVEAGAPWELSAQAHGYEVWRAGIGANVKGQNCAGPQGSYSDWTRVEDGRSYRSQQYQTWAVRDDFLSWIAGLDPDQPWFATLAFQAPHAPFHVPPGQGSGPLLLPRDRYELMLTELDATLADILGQLDLRRTLVIVLGDNGTPSGAVHATQDPDKVKGTTFEDGIRVPMVWAGPGVRAGARANGVVSLVDVLATLADLLGIDTSPRLARDGVSLARTLRDPTFEPRRYAFAGVTNAATDDLAVVTARWKLRSQDGALALFDLTADPREETSLAGSAALREVETTLLGWLLEHAP